jgi:hypothetical protein
MAVNALDLEIGDLRAYDRSRSRLVASFCAYYAARSEIPQNSSRDTPQRDVNRCPHGLLAPSRGVAHVTVGIEIEGLRNEVKGGSFGSPAASSVSRLYKFDPIHPGSKDS